jgi:predicted nucleic acid-binding protein
MRVSTPALYTAEPQPKYLVRQPVVIDCSVFAALIFREAGEAEALDKMRGRNLHAPHLLAVEIASVARKKAQLGHTDLANKALAEFEEADMVFHSVTPKAVLELAMLYQLTAYDSTYLWLATKLRCPLLTFDAKLGKAASLHLNSLE